MDSGLESSFLVEPSPSEDAASRSSAMTDDCSTSQLDEDRSSGESRAKDQDSISRYLALRLRKAKLASLASTDQSHPLKGTAEAASPHNVSVFMSDESVNSSRPVPNAASSGVFSIPFKRMHTREDEMHDAVKDGAAHLDKKRRTISQPSGSAE